MLSSSCKIPGGKLVKIKLWVDSGKIERITILGDFFLHPEEVIETIESSLVGNEVEDSTLLKTITDVLQKSEATLIGASARDLVEVIMMAWKTQ
jgi:lipoate-protein ligase A